MEPYVELSPRWVRVRAGGEWIADSRRLLVVGQYGLNRGTVVTYAFPPEDVRDDLLRPSDEEGRHDIHAGDEVIEAAAELLADPPEGIAAARGTWTFSWTDPRIEWFEEAQRIEIHPRDPHKRVDAVPSERHVRIERDGELLAESRRPVAVFETGLPTRWYLPPEDVRLELFEPTDTITGCPYKGTARYWSVKAGDRLHPDLAWSYPDPLPEIPRIKGLVAFFDERTDVIVDGEPQERPRTQWSR